MEVHGQLHAPADLVKKKKIHAPIEWAGWVPELICMLEKRKIAVHADCMISLQFVCIIECTM